MTHILVPMDDSDPARMALDHACETYPDAEVTVLHVTDSSNSDLHTELTGRATTAEEYYQERTDKVFQRARTVAASHDQSISTEQRVGKPRTEIVRFAEEADVDHVVAGSHGRTGPSRVLLGSVAEHLVRRSPVPVTIVR
jgi:nucleotide-binding universal stress UspA family protein